MLALPGLPGLLAGELGHQDRVVEVGLHRRARPPGSRPAGSHTRQLAPRRQDSGAGRSAPVAEPTAPGMARRMSSGEPLASTSPASSRMTRAARAASFT